MKKFLKIGCLGTIALVVLIFVIGFFTDDYSIADERAKRPPKAYTKETKNEIGNRLTDSIADKIVGRNFRINRDEFKKTTFYKHNLTPGYNNMNWVFPYIGLSDSSPYLRFKMQYAADDWLFVEKVQFLIDGNPVDFATGRFETDNSGGKIWEWGDLQVSSVMRNTLMRIAESKTTKVRYTGSQYYKDRTITGNEKKVIRETVKVFDSLRLY